MQTSLQSEEEEVRVIFEPNPGSQVQFLSCPYDELLYHGTRGPGKTLSLLMDYAQEVGDGWGLAWRGILFRQTYKQLSDVVVKSKEWFSQIFPQAKFNESDYVWKWPSGEELLLRYMDKETDYWNYHGHEYSWIGWEELTNWPAIGCYDSMMACFRSPIPNIPKRVRSTCNPWGAGHHWVKEYFIDATLPGIPITQTFRHPLTHKEITRTRTHIYGSVLENKRLMENDPSYLATLLTIKDENKRKAWLTGDWNIAAGGFFSDIWNPRVHVISQPFTPPKKWKCFTAFDWGSAKPFSLGMWTISNGDKAPDGNFYPVGALIRFDEWYGQKGHEANVGLRLTNDVLGAEIDKRLKRWEEKGVTFDTGVADPAIWNKQGGPSIYKQVTDGAGRPNLWEPAINDREDGWQQMRTLLAGDEDRGPKMYVMQNCRHWLRSVPILQRSEKNWDDVDTDAEDHAADETRYACMRNVRVVVQTQIIGI